MPPSKLIDILFCVGGLLVAEPDACCHYHRQPFSELKSPTRSIVTAATPTDSDMPVASVSVDSYKTIQLQVHGASDYEKGTRFLFGSGCGWAGSCQWVGMGRRLTHQARIERLATSTTARGYQLWNRVEILVGGRRARGRPRLRIHAGRAGCTCAEKKNLHVHVFMQTAVSWRNAISSHRKNSSFDATYLGNFFTKKKLEFCRVTLEILFFWPVYFLGRKRPTGWKGKAPSEAIALVHWCKEYLESWRRIIKH
ncbi:hypothetical protein C8F01DRAFT_1090001 [Mycena amicta]|nr:hypothetical protein C8F01DRAFT_1090001 [Mycena amicta]